MEVKYEDISDKSFVTNIFVVTNNKITMIISFFQYSK